MCRRFGDVLGLDASESQRGTDYSLLVVQRKVGTGEDDTRKDHPRVGREGADLGLATSLDRYLDPVRGDDRNHQGFCFGVLGEVYRVGDNVGGLRDGQFALGVGL